MRLECQSLEALNGERPERIWRVLEKAESSGGALDGVNPDALLIDDSAE